MTIDNVKQWIYEFAEQDIEKKRNENGGNVSQEEIASAINNWTMAARNFPPLADDMRNVDVQKLAQEVTAKFLVDEKFEHRTGFNYRTNEFKPWLNAAHSEIDWTYWNRYEKYLRTQKMWRRQTISTLDIDTNNILDSLPDPRMDEPFDCRGLVVAAVQSGKTANYTGLIAKASDAGYKVIVIMAGIYNALRDQTQERLEEGFIGYDQVDERYVGIGRPGQRRPLLGTSRIRDFNKATQEVMRGITSAHVEDPLVFVIKKNASVLKELTLWLETNCRQDLPFLLIDDEADNASINVKYDKGNISRINGQIRQMLQLFPRHAYVGYTATPFANVLIDSSASNDQAGDDIFPRNFIYTLEASPEYFGATKVFGDIDEKNPRYIRFIIPDENAKKLRSGDWMNEMPPEMEDAIDTFIVACAIRILDGLADEHMTMMINASPYTTVQKSIRALVENYLRDIQNAIKTYVGLPASMSGMMLSASPHLKRLKKAWEREYRSVRPYTWEQIRQTLVETVKPMSVKEINSLSSDSLNYHSAPQRVIAIGGYRLSRGLTLEGLMISYYDRNASAYDSLMQMARWFGYRMGYEELCRIWMTRHSADWYAYVTDATSELITELRAMRHADATPEQYGLRIKSSPDTLMITARNKMGAGEIVHETLVRLDGAHVETRVILRDANSRAKNEQLTQRLFTDLTAHQSYPDPNYSGNGILVRNVDADIVRRFIRDYCNSPRSFNTEKTYILSHIDQMKAYGRDSWDIFIPGGSANETTATIDVFGKRQYRERRRPTAEMTKADFFISHGQLSGKDIEVVPLSKEQREMAEARFRQENGDKDRMPSFYYRQIPDRNPMLVVHPVAIQFKNEEDYRQSWVDDPSVIDKSLWPSFDYFEEAIGWSISFPAIGIPATDTYMYNDVMLRSLRNNIEDIEDEYDEDTPDK
ncbi:Z1 domain-containing protein [Bifidobacterium choloepi]|nr:Z1 domain-containing protein [Bifidobacterium choloepi]